MNKKKITLILLGLVVVAVVFFGLTFSAFHALYDDEIDQALRSQMQRDSLTVLNALKDEEYGVVMSFFSPTADQERTRSALPEVKAKMGNMIGSAEFKNFHDHHVMGSGETNQTTTVMSAHALSEEPGSYFVYQNTDTQNSYVSLFTSEVNQTEILYTIIWGEYEDGWKIRSFDIASFGWSGKRGPDWLEEVKNVRAKSGDIAAYLTIKAVSGLFRPSPVFAWKDLDSQVKILYEEISNSIAPMFSKPIVVQELDSKPTIYGLDARTVTDSPGQVIPAIQYVSKYENSQVDLIKEEANQMAPHMEKYFQGVNDLAEHLLFVAYESPPIDPKKQYKTYTTVVEIK